MYCIAWNEVSDSDVCCSMEHFRLIPLIFCIFSDLNNTHSQNLHHKLSHIYCIFLWTVLVFILFSFTYHTLNISALACNETSNLTARQRFITIVVYEWCFDLVVWFRTACVTDWFLGPLFAFPIDFLRWQNSLLLHVADCTERRKNVTQI